jgi:hypothetical protein
VAYDFFNGKKVPEPSRATTRYRWLCMRFDWPAFKELRERGELNVAQWLWSLAQAPKVYEIFSWSDPLPFLRFWATRIGAALSRRMHRWLATAS